MNPENPFQNIYQLDELVAIRKHWLEAGERVVFTNGVFDLIHPGHVAYMKEASELGSKLIVGINADSSVKMLNKGTSRPINNQLDRARVLAALKPVDAVVIFKESTPLQVIMSLLPDVLVKGGDYKLEDIVGSTEVIRNGGEVKRLQFLEGHSTTSIETRIVEANQSVSNE